MRTYPMNFYHSDDIPPDLLPYFEPAPEIGLEETPDAYVAKLVEVFREVWRVLKNDGTLWLNLGDSYAASQYGSGGGWAKAPAKDGIMRNNRSLMDPVKLNHGLKPKDLCGIPWRVAFALQADGWYLRSDIIWHKPNPMPESVTDRPTKAHEYLFLLSKQERYFYDADSIRERGITPEGTLAAKGSEDRYAMDGVNSRPPEYKLYDGFRNKRSVWTVPTAPYSEAHFATYPPDLIKPCILAGTKAGDTVLDPFAGSGTTGAVVIELGRKALLIELNLEYIPLIKQRCDITLGFAF